MNYLLDTSVLIEASGKPDIADGASVAISVVSLSELHRGVLLAADPAERARRLRRLTVIENAFEAVPVTSEVARMHGALGAAVLAIGRQPRRSAMDLQIAATAAVHGATLLTHNIDDFAGLEAYVTVVVPTT